jgi:hypothetical protein
MLPYGLESAIFASTEDFENLETIIECISLADGQVIDRLSVTCSLIYHRTTCTPPPTGILTTSEYIGHTCSIQDDTRITNKIQPGIHLASMTNIMLTKSEFIVS